MSRSARKVFFDSYGGAEVLSVHQVDEPTPSAGQVRVRVRAAGLNPVDYKIFAGGSTAERFGINPPCGNGNDYSGIVDQVGDGVEDLEVGQAVYGGARFHAQADYLVVDDLTTLNPVPAGMDFEVAATLDIAGRTAIASVGSVALSPNDTVLVSAAAGGVGILTVQLARRTGATVVGTASKANHELLRSLGVIPVEYGPGMVQRLRDAAPQGYDAMLDNHGMDSLRAGLELGIAVGRMNSVAEKAGAASLGIQSIGRATTPTDAIRPLADLISRGEVVVPLDSIFELERVGAAYSKLMTTHVTGKIVLDVSLSE